MGWGREEISEKKYWGGENDIQAYLRSKGYTVYTVSVGPISSNYDCAIETFYQIKGGQLDYGETHSEKYKIVQNQKESTTKDTTLNGAGKILFTSLVIALADKQLECYNIC